VTHFRLTTARDRCTVIFFWAKLVRNGRIRAVEVRSQKFRADFSQFGRISSIAQPNNLLNWGNFAQIERNLPEIFGAKLNCAGSPISGEKNNYCVEFLFRPNHVFMSKKSLNVEICDIFFIILDTKPILPSYSICGK
jgi:hypothetical protein